MLTKEDIQTLIEAEKEVFTTKADFEEIKKLFSNLQASVDAYAKKADTYFKEMTAIRNASTVTKSGLSRLLTKLG